MSARILAVDDSASVRMTTTIALSNAGYQVTEAVDGQDGLNKICNGAFDLVVTDLNMPNMNGLEMIEAVRKLPSQAGLPMIFLTTESDGALKARAKQAGATGWMTKPFDPERLVTIVRKVLGK
ncbi:two-component system response regulator (plasmid) [Neorhizobium sp. SOG26]|uniref:Response regulator n=1 Tax=Neorhizobium turbinariae TaxID=2937795 RepID=A0ABT0IPR1_9HYPH|nr:MULTISPECIES: response regulator [Neorhizobium]AXV17493.1 two-component system response regulator [Neorhizobium sp. SOG26]MCK8779848.1 response regulator [Neorhizobium turbinariae]